MISRYIKGLVNQSIILWVSLMLGLGVLTMSQAETSASLPTILSSSDTSHYSIPKTSFLKRYESYAYILSAGAVVFAMDRDLNGLSQDRHLHGKIQDGFFNNVEYLGTRVPYLVGVPALVGAGLLFNNSKYIRTGGELAAGFLVVQGFTQTAKLTFGRKRPFQTDSPYQFFQGGTSFFSGHTSSAFTFATVVSKNFPKQNLSVLGIEREIPLVPILVYSVAGAVGLQRLYHNVHWASDVYVGALAGYGVGWLVVHFGNKVYLNSVAVIPSEPPMISVGFQY